VIKVFPQDQLNDATSFFSDHRFFFVRLYWRSVEVREVEETSIYVELRRDDQ
jgi:hypothetical protein